MRFKLFVVLLLLLFSVGVAHCFEDTGERYPNDDPYDYWFTTNVNYGEVLAQGTPLKYIRMQAYNDGGARYETISTIDTIPIDYIAFTTVRASGGNTWLECNLYDDEGVFLVEIPVSLSPTGEFIEIKLSNTGNLQFWDDGVFQSNLLTGIQSQNVYFGFKQTASQTFSTVYYDFDDFTTTTGVIGMPIDWDETYENISMSYGIGNMYSSAGVSFPDETIDYNMVIKYAITGATTNTTHIDNVYGVDTPSSTINLNRSSIFGLDYGTYLVDLKRDGSIIDSTYFNYAYSGAASGTIILDGETYSQGQTAIATYTLTSPDFSGYTYKIKSYDVYATVVDTHTISTSSGTINQALLDYDAGLYYFILQKESKISGSVSELAHDYATVSETVYIHGNITEAVSGTNMHNVSVSYLQGTTYYNTTSALDGTYNVSDLSATISTTVNSNVTYVNDSTFGNESYNLSAFSFTPLAAQVYNVDLILFNVNHTYDNVSAYGLIYDNIYHQPINTATVNIYNDTWSNSTTSTATGYYVFHNLISNGTYSLNATATGYTDTIEYEINTTTSNATRQDIPMSTLCTVTVKARDATTLAYLSDFTATLDGTEGTAINGTVTFSNIEYGLHAISAIADDFYPSATTPLIDEDTEVVLDLTRLASQYYAPHHVKFTVMSLGEWAYGGFGTLYEGVTTNVYLGSSATGDVYKTNPTGDDGAVTFELTEDIQYTLTFIDATQGIDEIRTLYPIKNEYEIVVFSTSMIPDDPATNNILFGCYGQTINLTHGYINVSFNDTSLTTTLVELWINDTNMTNLYYFNTTDTEKAWSQVVPGGNASYAVTFKLENTELSEPLIINRYIKFDDEVKYSLGLDEGWKYQLIAVIIISVIALLFSAINAEKGAVITVLVGWLMVFTGWLTAGLTVPELITLGLMMLFATLIAFGSVIRAGDAR